MSLLPPPKVEKLQGVLRTKAKESPGYRFYALYDKMYREDVLAYAYRRCKANGGAAGVDAQTFADIEAYCKEKWLDELALELKNQTYFPQAVRRVWIPKADGKQRPLGIPTIRDRVVQMAFMVVVEPIFDEDLQPEQHAYRANHSAHQAIREVQAWLDRGYTEVVDADLSGYFDTIPHTELMLCVARRISDSRVLKLVKQWLEAPVEETDDSGRKTRTTRNKDEHRGTPQGGVASPLLANLYMRRFVLGWKLHGYAQRMDAHIVYYADDFVICTRPGHGPQVMSAMQQIMGRLRLTVNTTKTRLCRIPDEPFKFLGYQFSELHGPHGEGVAHISGKLRHLAVGRADFPAVGEWVALRPSTNADPAVIEAILERTNKLSRMSAGDSGEEQLLATNLDILFLVTSLNRDLNPSRLERFLAAADLTGCERVSGLGDVWVTGAGYHKAFWRFKYVAFLYTSKKKAGRVLLVIVTRIAIDDVVVVVRVIAVRISAIAGFHVCWKDT